jgi:hypothetical protein
MFSRIRKRITYANVAMTLALVFAMSGGAYAAKHYLITSTKQISPKVLTALKGKNGTNGTNGTNGANGKDGAQGAAGAQGPAGEKGSAGEKGEQGLQGTAGPKGTTGAEGVCSTSSCHLPTGVTETGEWNISQLIAEPGEEFAFSFISFTVPLASSLAATDVHFIKPTDTVPTGCSGNAEAPGAASGNLCVFAKKIIGTYNGGGTIITGVGGTEGADRAGAQLVITPLSAGEFIAQGTWAVTG